MTNEEIIERVRGCPEIGELVQVVLDGGGSFDCQVLEDRQGQLWLRLESDICAACGLPNVPELTIEHEEQHIFVCAFCKDCTAEEAMRMRESSTSN